MVQDLIDWLRGQIAEHGLGKVLLSVAALPGAVGTACALFGSFPLRVAAFLVMLLVALTLTGFLLMERGTMRSELTKASSLLQRYCQVIHDRANVKFEFSHWEQTIVINQRGDAVATRRIRLAPAGQELHFLCSYLRYYGAAPLTPRLRRAVKATAREISGDGVEGARFTTTTSWPSDSEHQVCVHFSRPIPSGAEVSVEVEWTWPLYSADLMQGGVEAFDVVFEQPAENATHKVVLMKKRPSDRFTASQIGQLAHFECQPSRATYHVMFSLLRPSSGERFGVRIDKAR
jgi:membrane protein implicated in regulation of membrane protease activity